MKASQYFLLLVMGISFVAGSIPANAAYIDKGTFTTDTTSGLDWLDLSATRGLTFDAALAENAGWRLGTQAEVRSLVHDFFGLSDADFQPGYFASLEQSYIDKSAAWYSLFGKTTTAAYDAFFALGQHYSYGRYYSDPISGQHVFAGTRGDDENWPYFFLDRTWQDDPWLVELTEADFSGVFLVKPSVVPIPAAVWLFGSGLIGLAAKARRKSKTA